MSWFSLSVRFFYKWTFKAIFDLFLGAFVFFSCFFTHAFFCFFCSFLLVEQVRAKDFGVRGEVFEIKERYLLHWIKGKLKELEIKGELKKMQEFMQEQTRKSLFRPKAVEGISIVKANRSWIRDPTYQVKQDIVNHKGQVLHSKGKIINPLDFFDLPYDLLFIDGDDPDQMKWALGERLFNKPLNKSLNKLFNKSCSEEEGEEKRIRKSKKEIKRKEKGEERGKEIGEKTGEKREESKKKKPVKIILVKGAILKLIKENKLELYFDQQGVLTRYFGIQHVPSKVTQEGKSLKVEEIDLNELKNLDEEEKREVNQTIKGR